MVADLIYNEDSFLAGIAIGRELKGWALLDTSDDSSQGGELSHITVRSQPTTFREIPAEGYYGIGSVIVEGDSNLKAENIKKGISILGILGSYAATPPADPAMSAKKVTITKNGTYTYYPDSGYSGISRLVAKVEVPVTEEVIDAVFQSKEVTPRASGQTVKPDDGYNALSSVYVKGDSNLLSSNIKQGVSIFGVTGSYIKTEVVEAKFQSKSVAPGKNSFTVSPDSGYDGLSYVQVAGSDNLIPSNIREGIVIFGVTGTYSSGTVYQDKVVTPNASGFTVTSDTGYNALSTVTVRGDSNLKSENIAKGATIFGVDGSYISPMKPVTVIPSQSEQTIVPGEGYYGFSEITVAPCGLTGDYSEGFSAGVASRDAEVEELERQIQELTASRDTAYDNGYSAGYEHGLNDLAGSYRNLDEEEF